MPQIAKVFNSGNSQAVRLPKEFRLNVDEVEISREGDALIRPSQDARAGYGHAVTLSRIDRLTPREFHETPIGAVTPSWHPRVRGTHTIARSSLFEVVDGRLLRFRRRG